jgi:hypothetical protein
VLVRRYLGVVSRCQRQARFDRAVFDAQVMQAGLGDAGAGEVSGPDIASLAPAEFSPMSDTESFDRVTLSDKINGKADGYLDAGFLHLTCRRFMSESLPDQWFEFYLYDMEIPRNAFSIYSKQKRDGVADQDFTEFAYATENAVFLASGKYYIEIISAAQDPDLVTGMIQMAENFIRQYSEAGFTLPELAYLPTEGLDAKSVSLIPKDGFGYSEFNNIFTGTYQIGESRVMAFVSIRETSEEAAALVEGYDSILSEFVGEERATPETDRVPGLVIVDLFGEYELFFARDNILAGVHGVADRKVGEKLAGDLFNRINDVKK